MIALSKIAEDATTITLGWVQVPNAEWYLFYAADQRVSTAPAFTSGAPKTNVKFSKGSEPYEVVVVTRDAANVMGTDKGVYTPASPPPTPGVPANFRVAGTGPTTVALAWSAVQGAATYKLATIFPGGATTYSQTAGLAFTTGGLQPSTEYEFDIQTVMADGTTSPWHGRIKGKTEAGGTPPPPSGKFRFALGSSGDESRSAQIAQSLSTKLSRSYDHGPGTAASAIQSSCQLYQSRGIRPYILCNWPNGSDVEALTPGLIPAWATAVGPGGTWYQAHPEWAGLAVQHVEMGNEWFYNYRGGISQAKCQQYARAFRDTAVAVKAANPGVGLLFMTDIDNQGVGAFNNMVDWFYQAVPNIHDYIAGYTFHVYGPPSSSNVFPKMKAVVNRMESHGAPKTIPIWVTEDGISSDNGRALTDNYGWPVNMTYAQAGAGLRQKLTAILADAQLGPRMAVWTNYQAHDQQPSGSSNEREAFFGVVQSNQSAKGDMTQSVRDHAAAYPGP